METKWKTITVQGMSKDDIAYINERVDTHCSIQREHETHYSSPWSAYNAERTGLVDFINQLIGTSARDVARQLGVEVGEL